MTKIGVYARNVEFLLVFPGNCIPNNRSFVIISITYTLAQTIQDYKNEINNKSFDNIKILTNICYFNKSKQLIKVSLLQCICIQILNVCIVIVNNIT